MVVPDQSGVFILSGRKGEAFRMLTGPKNKTRRPPILRTAWAGGVYFNGRFTSMPGRKNLEVKFLLMVYKNNS